MSLTEWLGSREEVREYRLPAEEEWERVCRAGESTPFWFGETITPEQANFDHPGKEYLEGCTAEVGSFDPNGWGLYDMHGNVYEWCLDWYGPPSTPIESKRTTKSLARVIRGGAWLTGRDTLRSAFRCSAAPGEKGDLTGIRLVSPLSEPGER